MQKIAWIGICFFLITSFFFQIPSQAQSKKYFVITGKIVPEGGESGNGTIEITKNNKEVSTVEIPKNGRFRLELDFFNEFRLNFKYPGHFNKIIEVSTQIPQDVWERDNDFPPFPIMVQLLKEFEGIDKSFTLKPIGRIFYGKDIDNFEKESYISDIQFLEQVNAAKEKESQAQKESKSVAKVDAQDLAAKQKNFDQLIKDADTNYQRGEYQMALAKYQDAQKLFPDRAYPNDRIAELQVLVKALELNEKQKAEQEEKYRSSIAKANGLFDRKSYAEARPVYEEALQYKPGDGYANGRISEIDKLLAELAKQKQYNDLIAQADKNHQSKNFDQATAQYTQAKQLLPTEKYPQEQLDLIVRERQELVRAEQLDRDFNQAMQAGSAAAQQKDYLQALASYQKALGLKPENKLAQDKIAEVNRAIVAVENDKKYLQAIQLADQALAAKDYEKARTQYQEAIKFKATENYPKNKLAEISATEASELRFESLLSKGAKEFAEGSYDAALETYNEALTLKPQNQDVQKRIAEIQNLQKQQLQDQDYARLIAQADEFFNGDQLDESVAAYNKALQVKKSETYPKEQLQKISNYQALIKKADKSFDAKDFAGARNTYSEAIALKTRDRYASGKIAEIDKLLEEKRLQEQKAQAEQLAYNDAVKAADTFFDGKNYPASLSKYKEATAIKPAETYPQKRIREIESLLGEQEKEKARTEKEYQSVVAQADKLLDGKDYENAKIQYQKALSIKADESYPNEQVRKIDNTLAALKQQEAEKQRQEQEKREQAFKQAMDAADQAFAANSFDKAIDGYKNALTIKANDPTAKDKLGKTEAKLAEMSRLTQAYNKAIDQANALVTAKKYQEAKDKYMEAWQYLPDQGYPKTQIAKIDEVLARLEAEANTRREYDQAVAEGESRMKTKDLEKAKEAYTKAYNLIPSEPVPPRKIEEINTMLAEQTRKMSEQKAIQEAYETAVKKADSHFGTKEYTLAQLAYREALLIKPGEKYPTDQLSLINKLLLEQNEKNYQDAIAKGDNLFTGTQYDESATSYQEALKIKPNDRYVTNRLKEIDQKKKKLASEQERLKKLDEQYRQAITAADADFAQKAYPSAKAGYQKALLLKPGEVYPKEQIDQIETLLTEQQKTAETDRQYAQYIKQAQAAFDQKKLKEARDLYQKGLDLKPNEQLPPQKIAEIDKLLAVQEETARLAAQEEAQRLALEKADRERYDRAVAAGDKALGEKQYPTARQQYTLALTVRPNERYPKEQVSKIDELLQQEALNRSAERQKAIQDSLNQVRNQQFEQAMDKAEKLFNSDQLLDSKMQFQVAQTLKPEEKLPTERINAIDALLAQRKQDDLDKTRRELDEKYRQALSVADNSFREKSYTAAKDQYRQALSIKPDETYPQEQLAQIDQLEQKAKPLAIKPAETPRPTEKPLSQPVESEAATAARAQLFKTTDDYDESIRKADESFGIKDYSVARFYYYKASELKPGEAYPKKQIETIAELIDSQLSSEDITAYQQAVSLADNAFSAKNYAVAKFYYYKALNIKSWEQYPKDRIDEILALTHSLLSEKEEKEYHDLIAKADEALVNKEVAIARFYYNKATSIKRDEEYPRIKLNDIRKLIDQDRIDQENLEYRKIIETADEALKAANYSLARFNYNRALNLRPGDKYPKEQLKLIKDTLDKKNN